MCLWIAVLCRCNRTLSEFNRPQLNSTDWNRDSIHLIPDAVYTVMRISSAIHQQWFKSLFSRTTPQLSTAVIGEMIVQSDKMMREQSSNSSRVVSPPAASAPDQQNQCLSSLYRPSAAAAAAAAALSMAGAFPFGPFGTLGGLGGLRMLANQSSMSFPAGMLGIRPNLSSLLPFGLHPSAAAAAAAAATGNSATSRPSAYSVFPYASPQQFQQQQQQQHQQQQQMIQRQQHLQHQQHQQQQLQQQLPSPACGSAGGGGGTDRGERGSNGLLPHTPPTSPSLDENTDLNKTGQFVVTNLFNSSDWIKLPLVISSRSWILHFYLEIVSILDFQSASQSYEY